MEARTQLFTAVVLVELAVATSCRSLKYSVFKVGVFKNKFLWISVLASVGLQFTVLYMPQLHSIFDVTYPEAIDWIIAIAFMITTFASIEIAEYVTVRKR